MRLRIWMARVGVAVTTSAVSLAAPGVASAEPWTGFGTIARPAPSPTFQNPNPATPPVIPFLVSYDSGSGTLSVSVGGGPNTPGESSNGSSNGWFPVELYLGGPHVGQFDSGYLTVDTSTDPQANGSVDSPVWGALTSTSVTESADGQTLTTTWTNQLLAGIDDNFVSVNNVYAAPATFYLSGNGPYTAASARGSHVVAADTPFTDANSAVRLSASLRNLAATDVASEQPGGDLQQNYFPDLNPPTFRATGLPPGMHVDSSNAAIVGTPTKRGSYNSTITATTYYGLDGTPSYTGTLSYAWTVKPAPIPVALEYDGPNGKTLMGLRSKPRSITPTGDGSSFYAGAGSPRSAIRWSRWTATTATSRATEWDRTWTGISTTVEKPYPVTLTLSSPVTEHGVRLFTRLKVVYLGSRPPYLHVRSWVAKVVWSYGAFAWR